MTLTTPLEHDNMDDPRLDNPLLDHLGLKLVLWDVGCCEFELAIGARHLNRQSSLHGGVVATLLDAACGYAGLLTAPNTPPGNAWTVMLTISYLDKTTRGKIRAVGQVTRSARSLFFSMGKLLTSACDGAGHVQTGERRSRADKLKRIIPTGLLPILKEIRYASPCT
jgi:uncharacterized protein (TIGR00369 family)